MSTFVSPHLLSFSSSFNYPPHLLQLILPLFPLYLLPCLILNLLLPSFHDSSFCLYFTLLALLYPAQPLLALFSPFCIDITHFSNISGSLLWFIVFSFSLYAWGSSSDITTLTVTMVSAERDSNIIFDQTDRSFYTHLETGDSFRNNSLLKHTQLWQVLGKVLCE